MFVYLGSFTTPRRRNGHGTFSIDQVSGMLSPLHWVGSEGRKPRFFTTDPAGDFLYVANQDSDSIVVFRNHHGSVEVVPTGQVIETGTPPASSSHAFRTADDQSQNMKEG